MRRRRKIGGELRSKGASLEVDPLFILASRPFKPILCFRSMLSSSSSKLFVTWATISFRGRATKSLSDSV